MGLANFQQYSLTKHFKQRALERFGIPRREMLKVVSSSGTNHGVMRQSKSQRSSSTTISECREHYHDL